MTMGGGVRSIFFLNYIILFSGIVFSIYYANNLFVELKEKDAYKNLLTINSLAVKNVDTHLEYVSSSVEALGKSYKKLYSQQSKHLNSQSTYQYESIKNDKITFYNTSISKEDYPFQSDHASMILSNLNQNMEAITDELNIFHQLSPAIESIYNSFNFSWVYFTTANDFVLIYPYVPFINANEVYKPTEQHFYNAANFLNKSVGWEEPYYDLAGDGILVTASYPVYDDSDNILGVASHDITLDKIQEYVLDATSVYDGSVSFLISKRGKVISSSDKLYQSEIQEQSAHKYRGDFYYRTLENSKKDGLKEIVVSKYNYLNELGDELISRVDIFKNINTQMWQSSNPFFSDKLLLVSKIKSNGWLLVSYIPKKSILGEAKSIFYQTMFILAVFVTIIFVISGYFVMKHFIIPLDIINKASQRFGDGFANVAISYNHRNLLKNLFDTFNDMVKRVNLNKNLLEQKVQERTQTLQEEISRRIQVEKALRIVSRTDALTGIWNRGYFFELLKREIERCQRFNACMALIMIDIDLFKNINDSFGHDVGDQALKHIVKLVSSAIRKENIFARLGGEEFGLVLIETKGSDEVQNIVERIRKTVEENPLKIYDKSIRITISIGMTNLSKDDDANKLYIRSDMALYLAKENGRNRVEKV